jgi:hypothetical protein
MMNDRDNRVLADTTGRFAVWYPITRTTEAGGAGAKRIE